MPHDYYKIIKQLIQFEHEEERLIELYQTLLEFGMVDSLSSAHKALFKEYLNKLYFESKKHKQATAGLINKYKAR